MKIIEPAFFIFIVIFAIGAVITKQCMLKTYQVKIIYCDNRQPIIQSVTSSSKPSSYDIETYKLAVPTYNGQLNVCSIEVLKTLD